MSSKRSLAGIQYGGVSGITHTCVEAVMRLIQYNDQIESARLLTCKQEHGFLLAIGGNEEIAVKAGFASGYGGEGPAGLSFVLAVLNEYCADVAEIEISEAILERLNGSCLTIRDIATILKTRPVYSRISDYIWKKDWQRKFQGGLWQRLRPTMPWAIIHPQIADLALGFFKAPDHTLLTGYRRLEDKVRERTGLKGHGAKLFSDAFQGKSPKLLWKDMHEGEQTGRAMMFSAAYMAFRNPRSHKEPKSQRREVEQLREFLVLNTLFVLEGESSLAPTATQEK